MLAQQCVAEFCRVRQVHEYLSTFPKSMLYRSYSRLADNRVSSQMAEASMRHIFVVAPSSFVWSVVFLPNASAIARRSDTRANVRHVDIVTMWHNKLMVFEGQLDRAKETLARFVVRISYLLPPWLMVLDFSGMRTQVTAAKKTCSRSRR